jgi:hypothetical protein
MPMIFSPSTISLPSQIRETPFDNSPPPTALAAKRSARLSFSSARPALGLAADRLTSPVREDGISRVHANQLQSLCQPARGTPETAATYLLNTCYDIQPNLVDASRRAVDGCACHFDTAAKPACQISLHPHPTHGGLFDEG